MKITKQDIKTLNKIKKLCDKLGLIIDIESEANRYTKVSIIFPIGSFVMKFTNHQSL